MTKYIWRYTYWRFAMGDPGYSEDGSLYVCDGETIACLWSWGGPGPGHERAATVEQRAMVRAANQAGARLDASDVPADLRPRENATEERTSYRSLSEADVRALPLGDELVEEAPAALERARRDAIYAAWWDAGGREEWLAAREARLAPRRTRLRAPDVRSDFRARPGQSRARRRKARRTARAS